MSQSLRGSGLGSLALPPLSARSFCCARQYGQAAVSQDSFRVTYVFSSVCFQAHFQI